MPHFVVDRLEADHDTSGFESGDVELDRWLTKSARDSDGRNITRTWVLRRDDRVAGYHVAGYYAVAPCTLDRGGLTQRQARGLPMQMPAYLIAKLALDRRLQGQGLGSHLLMSALERIAAGGADLGGRYAVVDAINDRATSFYLHHGFEPLSGATGRLLLPVKDIRDAIARHRT